jgi:hypothetical protein
MHAKAPANDLGEAALFGVLGLQLPCPGTDQLSNNNVYTKKHICLPSQQPTSPLNWSLKLQS